MTPADHLKSLALVENALLLESLAAAYWYTVTIIKPPRGAFVLLYDAEVGTYRVGTWDSEFEQFDLLGCNPEYCSPTHWMALPPAPEEKE